MTRVSLVVSLAWIATAAAESQAPRRAQEAEVPRRATGIQPGTYRSTGFVTRFDPKGTWTTTSDGNTRASGRYSLEGNTITFRTTPPECPEERVTYRVVAEPDGFRLEFVSDSCRRSGADLKFATVRTIAK